MTYTQPEVCRILKIHFQTFYKLVRSGKLPSFRLEHNYRVTEEALREYMGLGVDAEIVIPPAVAVVVAKDSAPATLVRPGTRPTPSERY